MRYVKSSRECYDSLTNSKDMRMKKIASLAGKSCRLVVRSVAQPVGNNKPVEVEDNNKKVENNRQE